MADLRKVRRRAKSQGLYGTAAPAREVVNAAVSAWDGLRMAAVPVESQPQTPVTGVGLQGRALDLGGHAVTAATRLLDTAAVEALRQSAPGSGWRSDDQPITEWVRQVASLMQQVDAGDHGDAGQPLVQVALLAEDFADWCDDA